GGVITGVIVFRIRIAIGVEILSIRVAAVIDEAVRAAVLGAEVCFRVVGIEIVPGLPVAPGLAFEGEFDLPFEEEIGVANRGFGVGAGAGANGVEVFKRSGIRGGGVIAEDRVRVVEIDIGEAEDIGAQIFVLGAADIAVIGGRADHIFLYVGMITAVALALRAGPGELGLVEERSVYAPAAAGGVDIRVDVVGHEDGGASAHRVGSVGGIKIIFHETR